MRSKKYHFETSTALKNLLADRFEDWRRRHGGDLNELASRCGVSNAYLAQVRRYGRIPSQPVLILLALNLHVDGQKLFDTAGFRDPFPYESGLEITRPSSNEADSLFQFRFNTDAFSDTVRSIIRSELRQRSVKDILGTRSLRIGANYHMFWMFGGKHPPRDEKHTGVFPELAEMLGLALQKEVDLAAVHFSNYIEAISHGEIDLFGPTMIVPNLPADIAFSRPLFRLGISALFRRKEHRDLPELPEPSIEDLKDDRYQIALIRNSFLHLFANTRLKRPDSSLILCSSDEEALERVLLKGIARPAHLFLTNSMRALLSNEEHPKDLELLFATKNTVVDMVEVGIAVRPDWPEVIPVLNEAIRFLFDRGVITERLSKVYPGKLREVVDFER